MVVVAEDAYAGTLTVRQVSEVSPLFDSAPRFPKLNTT